MGKEIVHSMLQARQSVQEMADTLASARKTHEQFHSALSVHRFAGENATGQLYKELTRHQDMMKAIYGPLEEARRMAMPSLAVHDAMKSIGHASAAMKALEQSFVTPKIGEIDSLFKQFVIPEASSAFRLFMDQQDTIKKAMESMHAPWLNTADIARSVSGFSELQNIGAMVQTFQSFDDRIADALRTDLGDWRAGITWPDEIFIDPLARSDFYVDLGFNPALTDFPVEAFHEGLSIAGLRRAPGESEEGDVLDEENRARNKEAFDRLQVLEAALRRFIAQQMAAAYGTAWIKQRVSGDMRDQWKEKKEIALAAGKPERPLFEYADFTDYLEIIQRRDNWQAVFAVVFKRQTSIQESMFRLYPIRNCTMHARPITLDDEMLLYVEARRILKAIGFED